jgi:hypothetical protein
MEIITIIFIVAANCGELDPACEYTMMEGTKPSIQIGSLEQSPLPIRPKYNTLDEAKGGY